MYYLDDECSEEDIECTLPDKVRKGLYIGGFESTQCATPLQKLKITHILDLRGGIPTFPKEFKYLTFNEIVDVPSQDILTYFPKCIEFIEEGRRSGGVLVHCAAGVSRSATVVCAYLMTSESLTATNALEDLRKVRPCVCPNIGFKKQLDMWFDMGFTLEGSSKFHRLYQLQKISLNGISEDIQLPYAEDSIGAQEDCWACSSCRRKLFTPSNIIDHEPSVANAYCREEKMKCEVVYVEPIAWMSSSVQPNLICNYNRGGLGELRCPNRHCSQIVGSWSMRPHICQGCQGVVCPAFQIKKHKVIKLDQNNNVDVTKFSRCLVVNLHSNLNTLHVE